MKLKFSHVYQKVWQKYLQMSLELYNYICNYTWQEYVIFTIFFIMFSSIALRN